MSAWLQLIVDPRNDQSFRAEGDLRTPRTFHSGRQRTGFAIPARGYPSRVLPTADPCETGHLVAGRYRLGSRIGSGGGADVHRAHDELLDRVVAVKLFHTCTADQRFHDEARMLGGLTGPGLVTVYDADEHDGTPFLVLRYVEGGTLREAMDAGPLPPTGVARLGGMLAAALGRVHAAGLVHREVAPSTVLLSLEGEPCLRDFGVSCTVGGEHRTTPGAAYLAPEQARGADPAPALDVYALGRVLLECLTGARSRRVPRRLPPGLGEVLAAMTAPDPDDRPDAVTCARLLDAAAVDGVLDDARAERPRRLPEVARPRRLAVGIGVAAATAALALVWLPSTESPASQPAAVPGTADQPATAQPATTTPVPVALDDVPQQG